MRPSNEQIEDSKIEDRFVNDLHDLCLLNKLEESPSIDVETQKAIDWKKKRVMEKIRFNSKTG